jgi:Alpha amylase, catalytic domain/Bacterial Alpha amylase C-terminal domain
MPIHPIGKIKRKGSLGCPYSVADYREVNPEYGTKEDFSSLVNKAHSIGLKVMIDIVFNHAAHDSVLAIEHPEWFHQDRSGNPVSTVSDWSDVVDLKFPNPELERYLHDTLIMWVKLGVDGFRCDVASLVPIDFWIKAREKVSRINQEVIWLAESVDVRWISERRESGYKMNSDAELYKAFDITYDYDIWAIWQAAVLGKVKCSRYVDMLKFQDCIYPHNYIKLRCVENHDRKRIMSLSTTREQALAWTSFQAFNKGMFLIYAGQESAVQNIPSLFDIDKIDWGNYEFSNYLKKLLELKKDEAQVKGTFNLINSESGIQSVWKHTERNLYGIFNTESEVDKRISIPLKDGLYHDLLNDNEIHIRNGQTELPKSACVFEYLDTIDALVYKADLFDID